MTNRHYRASVTLWKALWAFIAVFAGAGAGIAAVELPETWEQFRATWPAIAVPLAIAVWRALENWRKNSHPDLGPRWHWPWEAGAGN